MRVSLFCVVLLAPSLVGAQGTQFDPIPEKLIWDQFFDAQRVAGTPAVPVQPSPTPALSEPRIQLLIQAEAYNRRKSVWPGFSVLKQPVLLYEAETRSYLIGHPSPPVDYRALSGATPSIFTRDGSIPDFQFSFRFHHPVNGIDTFAYRFEPGDDFAGDLATIVHERFHVHQETAFKDLPHEAYYAVSEEEDLALANLENKTLQAALQATDPGRSARYSRMFVAVRRLRYRHNGPKIRPVEDGQEQSEGTAKYVELKLTEPPHLGGQGVATLIHDLGRTVDLERMGKWRSYQTGAGQGFLLDRAQLKGWKEAVAGGTPIYDLTERAYPVRAAADRLVQEAKLKFGYDTLLLAARQQIESFQKDKAKALQAYKTQQGLELALPPSPVQVRGGFSNRGKIYIMGDGSWFLTEVGVLERQADNYKLRLTGGMAFLGGKEGGLRFFIPQDASLSLDGQAIPLSPGSHSFQHVSLTAKELEFSVQLSGTLVIGPQRIEIRWDSPQLPSS